MRIGIVTLYNSMNNGAFLQGYALQKVLKEMGHEVEFINFESEREKLKRLRKVICKSPKRMIFNIKKYYFFRKSWKKIDVSKNINKYPMKQYDLVIIGSDEMWNVTNNTFEHLPLFFGYGINAKKVATYAISCGQAKYEDIVSNTSLIEKKINELSARDENTLNIMEKIKGVNVPLVLDPTLLTTYDSEEILCSHNEYILLYSYGLDEYNQKKVKEFAEKEKVKIISAGFYNKWCDEVVADGPFRFLGLVKNAKYIITDTFHGTLFSIIYKKQFVVIGENKIKINSILNNLNLNNRIIKVTDSIESIMKDNIDYIQVYKEIDVRRNMSFNYIYKITKKM